ncbi:hypothetical protein Enr13x_28900 [Stieleria neptunia]|uniref:Uncharacterized protein n=1 Tax=Stieleria neptunia TaxID=2527979 RepID=A0A518HQG6_9BACT|nr:hypothetical protein Enr13x_28900 [Stieleria neptunia]
MDATEGVAEKDHAMGNEGSRRHCDLLAGGRWPLKLGI